MDPNNVSSKPQPTHINAYYADLADAETELAQAQGRVNAAKDAIVANGGTLPDGSADAEDVVVAGDEAQLKEDEAVDEAADVSEPVETAADETTTVDESPAEEVSEPTEKEAPKTKKG